MSDNEWELRIDEKKKKEYMCNKTTGERVEPPAYSEASEAGSSKPQKNGFKGFVKNVTALHMEQDRYELERRMKYSLSGMLASHLDSKHQGEEPSKTAKALHKYIGFKRAVLEEADKKSFCRLVAKKLDGDSEK